MVIDETVRCVLEEGFVAASAKHITERAGVTWGVIQYHFGDRAGLLMAVVDQGYSRFLDALRNVQPAMATAAGRDKIELLVNAAWEAFSSPTSLAASEILIATRTDRSVLEQSHLTELLLELTNLGRYVGDRLDPVHADKIGELIWTALDGALLAQMVVGATADTTRQRQALIDVLAVYIAAHESNSGRPRRRLRTAERK
jgi:TetR/AcrR family transcriptional regulator, regulator of cefoperazone and chloramphenicol sensitivity